MITTLSPYVGLWMLLAVVVLALALYRNFVSAHDEDRYVHISEGEARLIPHQVAVNSKIDRIDRWGESLTIIALVTGIALGCVYFYFSL
ncbi:MAG: hypothetical protein JO217_05795 [Acidobacteriaceae bacterium]|nr:hypothetical protein [Acidobacteriaceae bacterium]MBV9442190.1 hypothetical protein [Acidobacteriaceae bacterium]